MEVCIVGVKKVTLMDYDVMQVRPSVELRDDVNCPNIRHDVGPREALAANIGRSLPLDRPEHPDSVQDPPAVVLSM